MRLKLIAWLLFSVLLGIWLAYAAEGASDTQINFTQPQDQEHQGVVQLTNGTLVFVYEDESSVTNSQVLMRRFNTSLVQVGAETRVNVSTNDEGSEPVVAALTGGGFAVAYSVTNLDGDNYAVAFRRYDANAVALDATDVRANSITNGAQFHPQIAALTNGGFVLVWTGQSSTNQDIFYRRFNANGSAMDANDVLANGLGINSVTNGDQGSPAVTALKDGGFVIAYEDRASGDVFGVRTAGNGTALDAPGMPLGQKQFSVNVATNYEQTSPSVTALTNGGFVVTYNSETNGTAAARRVLRRIFSPAGPGGTESQVGDHLNRWQSARVATLANGDFVAVWQAYGEGVGAETNSWAVFGQRFNQAGAPQFLPVRVNLVNTNDQDAPFVAAFNNGNYVVSWESFGQDSSRNGIFAQTFLLNGELLPGGLSIAPAPTPASDALITFTGAPGRSYRLQWSMNLANWNDLLTTNTASGTFVYQLPTGLPKRVFRVQSL